MSPAAFIAIAATVTVTMATVDYAHARYSLAMFDHRMNPRYELSIWRQPLTAASIWSVIQWGAAAFALMLAVEVSWWLLPFEAVGLVLGTQIGGRRERPHGVVVRS